MWQTVLVDFNEVYERFRTPVWRLARQLTRSEEEALDTTQEIFLRVWRGLRFGSERCRASTLARAGATLSP